MNRHKSWLLFLLVVVSALNLYFHFSFEGSLEERGRWIDRSIGTVIRPIQTLVLWTEKLSTEGTAKLGDLVRAREENIKLKAERTMFLLQLQRLQELEVENDRLKNQMGFQKQKTLELKAARVISRDLSLFFRSLEIDLGSNQGIEKGMAIVSSLGVVGRVFKVQEDRSTVLLLSDLNSRIDGTVQRSRTAVIVGGTIQGALRLEMLPRRADLQVGDVLVSGGSGQIYPAGFKIGVVTGISQDPNSVLGQADLEPSVNFAKLEEVFVVMPQERPKGTANGP